jgi:Tol biopolymer transport system component
MIVEMLRSTSSERMESMIRHSRLTLPALFILFVFFSPVSQSQQPGDVQDSTIQKIAFEGKWYLGASTGGGSSMVEGFESQASQRAKSNIYIKDPFESKPRWIDEGEYPTWSPDGSRLAYCTTIGTNFGQIRVVNADGKGKHQLTHLKTGACLPEWSPDGKEIAITLFEGTSTSLAIVDENGTLLRGLGPGSEAHWSPDGKQLLFLRPLPHGQIGSSIWVMRADGSDAREILEDGSHSVQTSWLANGAGILFSSEREGMSAIFTVDLEGKKVRKVGGDSSTNWLHPAESPDGSSLIVDVATPANSPVRRLSVVQMDARAHSSRVLVAAGDHFSVVWRHKEEAGAQKMDKNPPPAP